MTIRKARSAGQADTDQGLQELSSRGCARCDNEAKARRRVHGRQTRGGAVLRGRSSPKQLPERARQRDERGWWCMDRNRPRSSDRGLLPCMHHHPRPSRCLARSNNCFGDDRPRRAAPPRVCRPWTRRRAFASLSQRARPREDSSCQPSVFAWPAERASRIAIDRAPAARQGPTAPIQDNLVNRPCKLCVLLL